MGRELTLRVNVKPQNSKGETRAESKARVSVALLGNAGSTWLPQALNAKIILARKKGIYLQQIQELNNFFATEEIKDYLDKNISGRWLSALCQIKIKKLNEILSPQFKYADESLHLTIANDAAACQDIQSFIDFTDKAFALVQTAVTGIKKIFTDFHNSDENIKSILDFQIYNIKDISFFFREVRFFYTQLIDRYKILPHATSVQDELVTGLVKEMQEKLKNLQNFTQIEAMSLMAKNFEKAYIAHVTREIKEDFEKLSQQNFPSIDQIRRLAVFIKETEEEFKNGKISATQHGKKCNSSIPLKNQVLPVISSFMVYFYDDIIKFYTEMIIVDKLDPIRKDKNMPHSVTDYLGYQIAILEKNYFSVESTKEVYKNLDKIEEILKNNIFLEIFTQKPPPLEEITAYATMWIKEKMRQKINEVIPALINNLDPDNQMQKKLIEKLADYKEEKERVLNNTQSFAESVECHLEIEKEAVLLSSICELRPCFTCLESDFFSEKVKCLNALSMTDIILQLQDAKKKNEDNYKVSQDNAKELQEKLEKYIDRINGYGNIVHSAKKADSIFSFFFCKKEVSYIGNRKSSYMKAKKMREALLRQDGDGFNAMLVDPQRIKTIKSKEFKEVMKCAIKLTL